MPYSMATRKILQATASSPSTTAALTTPTVSSRQTAGPAAQQLAAIAQQASAMSFDDLLRAKAEAAVAAHQGNTQAMADHAAAHIVTTNPPASESDEFGAAFADGTTVSKGEIRAFYVKFYNDMGAKLGAGVKVMTSA